MRRLQRVSITGHASGLDGFEDATAIFASGQASEPPKPGIERFRLQVVRVMILAFSVGLPEFDDGIWHRYSVAIEDTADQPEAFALGLRTGECSVKGGFETQVEERANGL